MNDQQLTGGQLAMIRARLDAGASPEQVSYGIQRIGGISEQRREFYEHIAQRLADGDTITTTG